MFSIGLSLLLHLIVFLSIDFYPSVTPTPKLKQIPIEIRTISKTAAAPKSVDEVIPSKPSQEAAEFNQVQDKRTKAAPAPSPDQKSSPAIGLAYKDLLPSASDLGVSKGSSDGSVSGQGDASASEEDSEGNGPYHGKAYQDIMIDSHSLQGIFDIPLFLRENSDSATASMELEALSRTTIRLILLKGDPFLRAVIWEQLKNPKATQSLYRIAEAMGEKFLKVSLSYSSQYASTTNPNRFAEDIKLRKGRVKIVLTFNKDRDFGPQMGGMALPDKDAELAKKRDRLATSALSRSKAFQRVIRNETVTN
jgi:hypothetical protein